VTVPASLEVNYAGKPTTCYSKSPSVLFGIDKGTVDEIINTTVNILNRDLHVPVGTSGHVTASAPVGDVGV